jgi:hypothetical protein
MVSRAPSQVPPHSLSARGGTGGKLVDTCNHLNLLPMFTYGQFRVSGRTGQVCQESGIYRCATHAANTIPLARGNTFPPCSWVGGHATTWILVQRA